MEWYSHKLRPFMWEFYGIMTAASQAGLTKNDDNPHSNKFYAEDLEKHNEHIQKLVQIHDEYLTRFRFMCEKIENKFFTGNNAFLFGERPTIVDYVLYQELLSAMILSGNGSTSEFLAAENNERNTNLIKLTLWYQQMYKVKSCKV